MKLAFDQLERVFFENLDVKELTRREYGWAFEQFKKWMIYSGRLPDQMRRADILAYKASLENSGKAESTMDFYLLVVRRFYQFVEDSGQGENIAAGIRYKRRHRGYYKEHLAEEEVSRLLGCIPQDTEQGRRDFAIVFLMVCTGLRCVEVSRLSVGDLHADSRNPFLMIQRKGETRKTTRFGVTPEVIAPTLRYLEARGNRKAGDPLFATTGTQGGRSMSSQLVSRAVRHWMRRAGVYSETKTAHSLRHTAAVRAIKAKVPIREVQVMLGHKRVETTEVYLASLDEEMRLINPAVKAMPLPAVERQETGQKQAK